MGCAQSSLDGKASSALLKPKLSLPLDLVDFLPQSGPLSRADYHKRLYSTDGAQEIAFQGAGLSLKYAFVSQRGCVSSSSLWYRCPASNSHSQSCSEKGRLASLSCAAGTTQSP